MPSGTELGAGHALGRVSGRSIVGGEVPPVQDEAEALRLSRAPGFHAVNPMTGAVLPVRFIDATPEQVQETCWRAWEAFHEIGERPPADRARLLHAIADEIMGLGDALIQIAEEETGLTPVRLTMERERTVTTLRLFGDLARKGDWVRAAIDTAEPSRRPVPKPDVRRMLRPLGPVAVFGAGNFPLAYSTAGGDTASALAAGCPVVVKGHPSHPATGELVARAACRAVTLCGFPGGTLSYLQSGGARAQAIGVEVVANPCVRAVGFTGSFEGGTSLAKAAAERPDPIPFFAEMGSVNPVFVLSGALESQAGAIAERVYGSLTSSNGQMCTCPGLLFLPRGPAAEDLLKRIGEPMNKALPEPMLSARVRAAFVERLAVAQGAKGVQVWAGSPQAGHRAAGEAQRAGEPVLCSPVLLRAAYDVFKRHRALHEEIFGPALLAVLCDGEEELVDAAALIRGSLTGTIWASGTDAALAQRIRAILEQRVGRLIFNGVPTGVEVCAAMVHGGPFPATNAPHATAVGPFAIERWCRPVCYQNAPEAFLPPELRSGNPLGILRLVNGEWTRDAVGKKPGP